MSNSFRDALATSCRILMRPVAKFFISSGMQYNEFIEIAKAEFINAACDLGSPNDTNTSIAERIGIGRKEISRARYAKEIDIAKIAYEASFPATILTRWHQDPQFVREDGKPRDLTASEFGSLVRQIDKQKKPKQMLDELVESEALQEHADGTFSPKMRYFIARGGDSLQVLRFGMRLGDLAKTICHNSLSDHRRIEASAYNSHVAISDLPLLRNVARMQADSLLQSLDDWLTAHSEPNSEEVVRAGVGVYLFEDDI